MSAIQPALTGLPDIPGARPQRDDYEQWLDEIRPAFEEAAATGRRFMSWQIKTEYNLPDPPDPAHQWGDAMGQFRRDGLIRHDGWGATRDKSGVRAWRGTRTAQNAARRAAEARAA